MGKTETLHEFCKDKEHVFFSCQECSDNIQLKNFSKVLLKENILANQYLDVFNDWQQALNSIVELPYKEKNLLSLMNFFDAKKFFPYYSILGGIPHYLNQFDSNLSIEEILKIIY